MDPPATRRLEARYHQLWQAGRQALLNGSITADPPPVPGDTRWGLSAVLRPRHWPAAVTAGLQALHDRLAGQALVYDNPHLHLTLASLEAYRAPVPPDDPELRAYVRALDTVGRRCPPLRVRLRGLNATAGGVLLQGWPEFDLQALRLALGDAVAQARRDEGLPPRGASPPLRDTAHVSLAVFVGPLSDAPSLVAHIEGHRRADWGTLECDTLSLVQYTRGPRSVVLTTLAEAGGGRPGAE